MAELIHVPIEKLRDVGDFAILQLLMLTFAG